LACDKSLAATVFSDFEDDLLRSSLDALDAGFFPVVICVPPGLQCFSGAFGATGCFCEKMGDTRLELPQESSGKTGEGSRGAAKSGAVSASFAAEQWAGQSVDPDLAAIVEAWQTLRPAQRAALHPALRPEIAKLVAAAQQPTPK
jgi:hypothetical protein